MSNVLTPTATPGPGTIPVTPFETAAELVLGEEGVLSNHSADPGGFTVCGISKTHHAGETAFWELVSRWRNGAATFAEVRDAALGIYEREYWNRYRCGELPWPLSLLLFDGVVNQTAVVPGPEDGVVEMLQEALGLPGDGVIGPRTISRAQGCMGIMRQVVNDFCARRALRYARKSNLDEFGLGLFRRLMRMHAVAVRADATR